jgi:hypothetical protein
MQHQPSGVEIIMRETESDACVGPDGVLQVRGPRATCSCAGVWPADKHAGKVAARQHQSSTYCCTGPCCARKTRRRASGAAVLLGVWQSCLPNGFSSQLESLR